MALGHELLVSGRIRLVELFFQSTEQFFWVFAFCVQCVLRGFKEVFPARYFTPEGKCISEERNGNNIGKLVLR